MKIIFCKTAHMKFYQGDEKDMRSCARYVIEKRTGGEKDNFKVFNVGGEDKLLGYTEMNGKRININNIEGCKMLKDDHVEDVLVVWCAVPYENKWVVVGWYKNATVYRSVQTFNGHEYQIAADAKDCVLLPYDERLLPDWAAPRARKGSFGIGSRSAVWYPKYSTQDEKNYIEALVKRINNY